MKWTDTREVDMIAPPPLIFAAPVLIGWLADWFWPLPIAGPAVRVARLAAGAVLVAGGAALFASAVSWFRRRGTPVMPTRPSTAVIRTGPYRFTRNPMYVGMAAIALGLAAMMNSWWPIALLAVAIVIVDRGVIAPEERYLRATFGAEYDAFTRGVRRWL